MLRFSVFENGQPAKKVNLAGAYLFGSDSVPLRADIEFRDGMIVCQKRTAGPAGLALLWPVDGVGRILLETTRLPEREAPYVLSLELARGQLMRLSHKREEWGLFDCKDATDLNNEADAGAKLLVDALKADDPAGAAKIAQQALSVGVRVGEDLSRFHAGILLERRKQTAGFSRFVLGCQVDLECPVATCGTLLAEAFDFATIPIHWKQLEPTEQNYNWKPLDTWIEWLAKNRVPVKGSGLVCFSEHSVPDWLYIWEHDFDTVRDLVSEHVRRVINRYGSYIQAWDVVSGIHAIQGFGFSFEQLIELTRIAATITKQLAPRSTTIIDLVAPWGEYYARNQQTIPPLLYAEMAIQTGMNFDGIGLQFCFGAGVDGMYVRDMFQISSLIEKFGNYGKPIHITAVQVPSNTTLGPKDADGGAWHQEWDEEVQKRWLREFYEIALSKPFVETITWRNLADGDGQILPSGGLLNADLSRKPAFDELVALREEILPDGKR